MLKAQISRHFIHVFQRYKLCGWRSCCFIFVLLPFSTLYYLYVEIAFVLFFVLIFILMGFEFNALPRQLCHPLLLLYFVHYLVFNAHISTY